MIRPANRCVSGAAERSSNRGSAGARTTAPGLTGSTPTGPAAKRRSVSRATRRAGPTNASFRQLSKLHTSEIRQLTKRNPQVKVRFPRVCRVCRPSGWCRPRCLLARGRGGAGRTWRPWRCRCLGVMRSRNPPAPRRPRTRGRMNGHNESRTADQLDGARHIAAAAAPHEPRTGRQIPSRARLVRRRGYGGSGGSQALRRPLGASSPPPLPAAPGPRAQRRQPHSAELARVNPGEMPPPWCVARSAAGPERGEDRSVGPAADRATRPGTGRLDDVGKI